MTTLAQRVDAISTLRDAPGSERILRIDRTALNCEGVLALRNLGEILATYGKQAAAHLFERMTCGVKKQ